MNLVNEEITHKVFGEGNIVDHRESVITVDFDDETKKFVYPDAIGKFIKLNDPETAQYFKKIIEQREMENKRLEKKRAEIKEQQVLEQQRRDRMKNLKIHESSQIVFWLEQEEQEQVFSDWNVFTGEIQSGVNKGQPNRVVRLQQNSAVLLTAREPDQPEEERQILGLYMVSEAFSGDTNNDGIIPAHPEFKLKLTEEEAAKMLFWNYYITKNYPHRITWNSGKYRYFDNEWTAQILKDIIALKTDEAEIKQAEQFLDYFCQVNFLDKENIEEPGGALKQ